MKIPSAAEQRLTYIAQLQPHVAEPIIEVGFLTSAGYVSGLKSDYAVGKVIGLTSSPMMGWLVRKKKTATRVNESRNDLVAVTASNVYLFEFPKRGEPFSVTAAPTVWRRADITAIVGARSKLSQPLHVTLADGQEIDYDISSGGGDYGTFSDAMRDLLLTPVSA